MEKVKQFIKKFLKKEAEAWTKREQGDLEAYNQSVHELYFMSSNDLNNDALGILPQEELQSESNLVKYTSAQLFKLTMYKNKVYGEIWIAYVSIKNSNGRVPDSISDGYILSKVNGELKIIGIIHVDLDEFDMEPCGWIQSIYNPKDLDLFHMGKFIKTERYLEPADDGFSLENYWQDKMTIYPLLHEEDFDNLEEPDIIEMDAEDNKNNRQVIQSLIQRGMKCKVTWL